ncbi:MAG: hypothetical protein WDZ51_13960 [Pirellulaceae bacterium]
MALLNRTKRALAKSCIAVLIIGGLNGCGGEKEIPGGTPGRIHIDGIPLREVQVTMYDSKAGGNVVGFGISDSEGRFELREPETLEGVWLPAGHYRFTLESVGEIYMQWPAKFTQADTSPLEIEWTGGEGRIELDVPEPTTPRG